MLNDVRHVDELELFLLVAQEFPNVVRDVKQSNAIRGPLAHMVLMS